MEPFGHAKKIQNVCTGRYGRPLCTSQTISTMMRTMMRTPTTDMYMDTPFRAASGPLRVGAFPGPPSAPHEVAGHEDQPGELEVEDVLGRVAADHVKNERNRER
jgi:hypothetical protein